MTYENLLIEADNAGIIVKELPLQASDGRCSGHRIAIRSSIQTSAQKADVLAEELGHYHTTVGRIIEQDSINHRKQEYAARLWAYDKRIGLSGIIAGYLNRCQNTYELAEFLDVSEEFLTAALMCYRKKYGCSAKQDGYIILFEPALAVMETYVHSPQIR